MKKNFYQKWTPLEGIPERLYCDAIHDDYEGFRILLRGEDIRSPILRVTFEPAIAYRNTNESYLLRTLNSIEDRDNSSLYIVKNSSWISRFHEESYGIYKDTDIIHYAIITPEDCIDVLAECEPNAEWL